MAFIDDAHRLLYPIWLTLKERYPKVPFDGIVGIVHNEASSLDPKAKRFETGVYSSVEKVKNGGLSRAFPGFNFGVLKAYIQDHKQDEAALKAMATSYGLGQLMGYHYIRYGYKYPDFTQLSLTESLECLMRFYTAGLQYCRTYEGLLRWWNTGSPNGKTYDPQYVTKGINVARAWEAKYGKRLQNGGPT